MAASCSRRSLYVATITECMSPPAFFPAFKTSLFFWICLKYASNCSAPSPKRSGSLIAFTTILVVNFLLLQNGQVDGEVGLVTCKRGTQCTLCGHNNKWRSTQIAGKIESIWDILCVSAIRLQILGIWAQKYHRKCLAQRRLAAMHISYRTVL